MKCKRYIVRLKPHENIFFGGEDTFGLASNINFKVRSRDFPQQTSVLGFIRHQLLLQCEDERIFNHDRIQNSNLASKLIGELSFRANGGWNYGKINNISSVFLSNDTLENEQFLFPQSREYQYDLEKKEFEFLELSKIDENYIYSNYIAKKGISTILHDINGEMVRVSDIIIDKEQIGITKNYEGESDNKAFYVQVFKRFVNHNYSFTFLVDLDEDVIFKSKDIVKFGGEQLTFSMLVESYDKNDIYDLLPKYRSSQKYDKVVLISDSYIDNKDPVASSVFANTETSDFRFLETSTTDRIFCGEKNRSKKYSLYKAGSVFYGNVDEIADTLKNQTFQNLGYNSFITVKSKSN